MQTEKEWYEPIERDLWLGSERPRPLRNHERRKDRKGTSASNEWLKLRPEGASIDGLTIAEVRLTWGKALVSKRNVKSRACYNPQSSSVEVYSTRMPSAGE